MSESLLDGLNEAQQEAVLATRGPVLVVAGPGSGKTRVLTHRIAHLIVNLNVTPDQILAVTFTNKAAREMRDRIDKLLGSPDATSGLWMGTFHSIGVRILRAHPMVVNDALGISPNFAIYDDADQISIAKQAILGVGQDPKKIAPRRMLSRISAAKSHMQTPVDFAQTEIRTYDDEIVARVYEQYDRILAENNALDFDDLLNKPIQLFDAAPQILNYYQDKFQYILVDEYQDTNRVQYILVAALADKNRNLFVVGDPDQSIYAWRHADIRNILDFERDFPDATRIDLEVNYRSTARIVSAADNVIRSNKQRLDRKLRTENGDGELISIRELSDQNHEAQFIVDEIRRLVNQGRKPGEIAVMYRTTAQSRALEEAFRNSQVHYRIVGGVRFYDRAEVKNAIAALRVLYNPADRVSLMRVIDNLPIGRGIGPKAVEVIQEWADRDHHLILEGFVALADANAMDTPSLTGSARGNAARLGAAFQTLRRQWQDVPLLDLFETMLDVTGVKTSFDPNDPDDMERQNNVAELKNDIARYNDLPPGTALGQYLEQVALISDADTMERREESVTLITLHSAKGLEFPVVFIAGAEEGLLPVSRAIENEYERPDGIEEERRLFYVGITRAMDLLYITYTGMRMSYGRIDSSVPSRFLDAMPGEAVKVTGARYRTGGDTIARLSDRVRSASRPSSYGGGVATAPAITLREYQVGQRVFHAQFGEGTVAEVVARHNDQEIAVDFARHGKKRLLASLAPLDVVN
jgi:DNA helicase-2/ATP-dependent DNA helicase PcrA